ncbi:polysaccharide deacetylase family protein [Neobacillus kokaensis]|uniref:NodB homology domain-containing protein n=1 Tax=Neobacillus kokaensis TaxID=2759023 RepID=A0ABQ3N4Y4_9BACI|nr:polysaccharide deacetylase family protein [Neobacillus kokaensis]GHH97585.1 hypothetical protein AM1BK_11280 [Neobacillus kokaensis]
MGKSRRGWQFGSFILVILIGIFFAGLSVTNYFQAKAAVKPANHGKNENSNQVNSINLTPEMIRQITEDFNLEKEWIQKQQAKALAWSNMKEISQVPAKPTKDTAAAPPATKDQTTPLPVKKPAKTVKSQQKPTKPVHSGTKKKIVYLTFDDGPAAISGDIIALLEKHSFKASFFMIDGNIRRYPEAVKLMVKSGEAIGLHSVSHDPKRFYASVHSVLGELNQNRNTLKEVSGIDSFLMRTPYGSYPKMKPEYRKAVEEHGYFMWDWNIDSKDWYYKDGRYVDSVIEQLNRMNHHQGPIVILLHERNETLAHLPKLLDYLSKHGYISKAIDSSMTPFQFKAR